MSAGKYFLDTNILIYALDRGEEKKRLRSWELIENAMKNGSGIISYQVVQEFLSTASREFPVLMNSDECGYWLDQLLVPLCKVFPTADFFQQSLAVQAHVKCSFYDALILHAAISQKCSILYSEDFQHGRVIQGVKIQNPFI